MNVRRMRIKIGSVILLMTALPYQVAMERPQEGGMEHDPETQLTHFAGRDFSTCRHDESAGVLLQSKSDTERDD